MNGSLRRLCAALLALLLVSSAATPVGTAAADHKCETDDVTLGLAVTASAEAKDFVFGSDSSEELDGSTESKSDLLGCDLFHGDAKTDSLKEVDNFQAKQEITSAAATSFEWFDNAAIGWQNGLQGLEQQARTDALAAYGRALDNGSTKNETFSRADHAIEDFYAYRKAELVADWNTFMYSMADYENKSNSEGLNDFFVSGYNAHPSVQEKQFKNFRMWNHTTPIGNGTKLEMAYVEWYDSSDQSFNYNLTTPTWEPQSNHAMQVGITNASTPNITSEHNVMHLQTAWDELTQQTQDTKEEVHTWINETYQPYQDGEISWAQAVGASAISRNFAADGDFQSWAMARLSSMGQVSPPENLSQVGYYTVTHENVTEKGLLASDGNPPSGAYERGETYNGSAISGPQYLIKNNSITNLDGPFTIEDITNDEGETIQKTVIKNVTYQAANASDLQKLLEQNQLLREELETRENELHNESAGGGGSGGLLADMGEWVPGLNGVQTAALILIAVLLSIAYLGREESNVNIPGGRY